MWGKRTIRIRSDEEVHELCCPYPTSLGFRLYVVCHRVILSGYETVAWTLHLKNTGSTRRQMECIVVPCG